MLPCIVYHDPTIIYQDLKQILFQFQFQIIQGIFIDRFIRTPYTYLK